MLKAYVKFTIVAIITAFLIALLAAVLAAQIVRDSCNCPDDASRESAAAIHDQFLEQ